MPGAPSSLQHLKMNLQGVLVAPFLIQCLPQLSLHCVFFHEQDKTITQELRFLSDETIQPMVWSCFVTGWWQGPISFGPSTTLSRCGNEHFLLPTSCPQNSLSAARGILSATLGIRSHEGFHTGLTRSERQPPCASAEGQPPGANLLTQSSTS